jgi:hypothetical protein
VIEEQDRDHFTCLSPILTVLSSSVALQKRIFCLKANSSNSLKFNLYSYNFKKLFSEMCQFFFTTFPLFEDINVIAFEHYDGLGTRNLKEMKNYNKDTLYRIDIKNSIIDIVKTTAVII